MRTLTGQSRLCTRCAFKIQQHRFYASVTTPNVITPIPDRAFIQLEGPDAVQFLQGLTTNNISVPEKPSPPWVYTAFLNAQGRVLNDAYIWPPTEQQGRSGWLVEVDEQESQSLLKHLKKHKLRSKIRIQLLEQNAMRVFSHFNIDRSLRDRFGHGIDERLQQDLFEMLGGQSSGFVHMNGPHHPLGSRLLIGRSIEKPIAGYDLSQLSLVYHVHRIMNGLPEGQNEIIRESALPQESNMDLLGGIDFRKGCYLGQELTIRTHHTGVVRKRILPVQLYYREDEMSFKADAPLWRSNTHSMLPPIGANISKAGSRKGRSAGKWLNGVGNVGLALCRLEMMTDVRLTEESSQYDPQQEFKVTWEAESDRPAGEVKLKAFVPQWMRKGIMAGLKSHTRKQAPDLEKNLEADLPDTDEELTSPHGAFGVKDP